MNPCGWLVCRFHLREQPKAACVPREDGGPARRSKSCSLDFRSNGPADAVSEFNLSGLGPMRLTGAGGYSGPDFAPATSRSIDATYPITTVPRLLQDSSLGSLQFHKQNQPLCSCREGILNEALGNAGLCLRTYVSLLTGTSTPVSFSAFVRQPQRAPFRCGSTDYSPDRVHSSTGLFPVFSRFSDCVILWGRRTSYCLA